jgi:hypothetical protein
MNNALPARQSGGRYLYVLLASIWMFQVVFGAPAFAAVEPFPSDFRIENISVNGVTLHLRVGGKGPAVVLLHGFADTGDMWAPLAKALYKDHTVIVPICAAWASLPSRRAATTRKPRASTSPW